MADFNAMSNAQVFANQLTLLETHAELLRSFAEPLVNAGLLHQSHNDVLSRLYVQAQTAVEGAKACQHIFLQIMNNSQPHAHSRKSQPKACPNTAAPPTTETPIGSEKRKRLVLVDADEDVLATNEAQEPTSKRQRTEPTTPTSRPPRTAFSKPRPSRPLLSTPRPKNLFNLFVTESPSPAPETAHAAPTNNPQPANTPFPSQNPNETPTNPSPSPSPYPWPPSPTQNQPPNLDNDPPPTLEYDDISTEVSARLARATLRRKLLSGELQPAAVKRKRHSDEMRGVVADDGVSTLEVLIGPDGERLSVKRRYRGRS